MTTDQTPSRYQVIDYKSVVDGKIEQRFAHIRDGIADHTITVTSEIDARDLIAKLSAWLDAPRLAARETADAVEWVTEVDETVMLLHTSAGEWGVRCVDRGTGHVDTNWFTTERDGRGHYADLRGKAICICGAECDEDEIDRSGDEPQCPKCVAAAVEAFKATKFTCVPLDGPGYPGGCGWVGTGADITDTSDGEPFMCPACDHLTVEEIRQ